MGARGPKPGDQGYRPPRPLFARVAARSVLRSHPALDTPCCVWTGATNRKGYGLTSVGSRVDGSYATGRAVHRVMYEALVGRIPDGLTLDHLCEVKACWNPAHLEPVTNAENKRRAGARMTACRRGHPRTPENVYERKGKKQCRACKRQEAAVTARNRLACVDTP